ncbi:SMI1/KNR4 family protein [Gloeocapsopsis crepidinum]|uniref:SMI1/KNR4 family protein n=1 Tax=Gloeocapsopsis crepidinum TaxID=693223 RepID=UPI001D1378F2|nr:SMI1/KNR4 family protein [Gloeocapsopsis crepidinum]
MYDWLCKSLDLANDIFREFSLDCKCHFNSSVQQEEINKCERELNLSLPRSYREFLLRSNGAHLFYSEELEACSDDVWWAGSGIKIFGTGELLSYRHYRRITSSPFNDPEDPSILAFAYLGRVSTGDFCAFDTAFVGDEYPVLDCDQDYPSSKWKESPIAFSFEEWLLKMFDRIVNHKSLPEYWFSDTLHNNSLGIFGSSTDYC